ncbi:class I glutamine amidotransferase-like protein [Xylariales sp. PMI_506]|nr:class I glutamine amidotransferase-like protein [Xylariales sp. PMI_506]
MCVAPSFKSPEHTAPVADPMSIAILLNSYKSHILPAIRASYVRTIGAVAPDARLSFFEPANKNELPDPALFDLIVLGGANVDPRTSHPWILRIHDFLRHMVSHHPRKKVVGICWGHQTIARVFGGELADMDVPEMGVTSINLTDAGKNFFPHASPSGVLRIQQHHRREVAAAGKDFLQLAQGNQILINESNTILTFQGHPEKDAQTARLRMNDAIRWFGFDALDEKAWAKLEERLVMEHEGAAIWDRIFKWVRESDNQAAASPVGRQLKM